jgi:polar amino acid transport system substrate-binding protein
VKKLVGILLVVAMAASVALAQDVKIGDCPLTGTFGSDPITPVTPDVLTVETNLPAPGWWNGNTPSTIKSGYEYCLAANIAYRAGLKKVKVENVSFAGLVAGLTKDFDIAFSQSTITPERAKVVDFSTPYYTTAQGVLVKTGADVTAANIASKRIGVQQATTGYDYVKNKLHAKHIHVYTATPDMFTALLAGQIDAVVLDTAIVLVQADQSNGKFAVIGQYKTGEQYGAIYPKGSPNEKVINKVISDLKADGTLKQLSQKYLAAEFGKDPTSVPDWQPQ